jgi:hypothetical protein
MALIPTIVSVRSAIKSELQTAVTASVPVSDYFRWFFDPNKFFEFFRVTGGTTINGWEFDIDDIETEEDTERFRFFHVVQWRLFGYFGVKDASASSKLLSDQIETILEAFDLNTVVFGIPERPERAPRHIIEVKRGRQDKGEYNCWVAEMTLRTEHIKVKAS